MVKSPADLGREMMLLGTYEDYDAATIITVLKAADTLYHNDEEAFLDDSEYDALRKYAEGLEPHNSYFTGVGAEVRGGKVKLPYQMGSLDQVQIGGIEQWVSKNNLDEKVLIATDKLDGVSALIIYDKSGNFQIGYSRGDGTEGQNWAPHINRINSVPNRIRNDCRIKAIRGELIISHESWKTMEKIAKTKGNKKYKNPRNCLSGLMNSLSLHTKEIYALIDFVAYEIIDFYEKNN